MTVYETICDQVRFSTGDISSLESFALSTSVIAELARHPDTAHLDLDVEIRGNSAILRGDVEDANEMDSIQRVLLPVLPEATIDLSQIRLADAKSGRYLLAQASGEVRSQRSNSYGVPVAPRLAWAFAGVSGLALAVLAGSWLPGHWLHSANGRPLSLAGVITDSNCGFSHKEALPAADCVRACVRTGGAKYVLNSGSRTFTLADQGGEALAGQRIVATGFLDGATGNLQFRSVRTVAR